MIDGWCLYDDFMVAVHAYMIALSVITVSDEHMTASSGYNSDLMVGDSE